jgi:hypothetical protein
VGALCVLLAINRQDYVQSTGHPPEGWKMPEQGFLFGQCDHGHTVFCPTPEGPHHGKAICVDCGKFMGWVAKPENIDIQKRNAEILTALSKIENLPAWERQFVRDLVTHKHISPRQQQKLYELRDRFLKGGDANDGFHGETLSPDRNPSDHV